MHPDWTTLVEPKELAACLGRADIIVVDCRFSLSDTEAGRRAYMTGHIPGARYAHLDEDLSGPIVRGTTGRHPLPEPEALAGKIASWGISNTDQVICYDDAGGAIAARLWWLLNWLGHGRVAVLNGGWTRWTQLALPVSTDIPVVSSSRFAISVQAHMVVSAQELVAWLENQTAIAVDARDHVRYTGELEPIDPVAGHIPGAISLPFKGNLDEQGCFHRPEILKNRYVSAGLSHADSPPGERRTVFYCGSGVTAAHHVLAMSLSGLGMARLYAGSWSEWILDPERKTATGKH